MSVTIKESSFYVSNTQRPIARQTEIILRNLLFTIVILELFGLFFLVIKLLLLPLFPIIHKRLQRLFKKNRVMVIENNSNMEMIDKANVSTVPRPALKIKPHRSALTNTRKVNPMYKRQIPP